MSRTAGDSGRADFSLVGMGLFLAALTIFFAAAFLAFALARYRTNSWLPSGAHLPVGLWISTFILLSSSASMQRAARRAHVGHLEGLRVALALTLSLGVCFLISQVFVWLDLWSTRLVSPRKLYFFYLLTGLHAVHVVGGLAALAMVTSRVFRGGYAGSPFASVRLTAVYWHFLGIVWLAMLALIVVTA